MFCHMPQESIIETTRGRFVLNKDRDAKTAEKLSSGVYPHERLLEFIGAYASGGVLVDVGAHIGTVAVPSARIVKRVIAFEASPETFGFLKRNVELNGVEVDARHKGLSDISGRASVFKTNERNAGAHTLTSGGDIEVSTLDCEVESADFIKIDVEGMELSVLRGGEKLIERSRPVIFFEVNLTQLRAHKTRARDIETWLGKMGYVLYVPLSFGGKYFHGKVISLSLLTAFITPRAWIFGGQCAPFDILAIHTSIKTKFPIHPALNVLLELLFVHLIQKSKRVVSFYS